MTSSIDMRNGFSVARTGSGIHVSTASMSSMICRRRLRRLRGLSGPRRARSGVVTGEAVARQELTDLHLDELEELFVIDLVDLVRATTM